MNNRMTAEDKNYTVIDEPAVFAGCDSAGFGRRTVNSGKSSSTGSWGGSGTSDSVEVAWSIKLSGGMLSSGDGC